MRGDRYRANRTTAAIDKKRSFHVLRRIARSFLSHGSIYSTNLADIEQLRHRFVSYRRREIPHQILSKPWQIPGATSTIPLECITSVNSVSKSTVCSIDKRTNFNTALRHPLVVVTSAASVVFRRKDTNANLKSVRIFLSWEAEIPSPRSVRGCAYARLSNESDRIFSLFFTAAIQSSDMSKQVLNAKWTHA